MGILNALAIVASSIITIVTCLTLFVTPFRKWIVNKIKKDNEREEEQALIKEIHQTLQEHIEDNKAFQVDMLEKYELQRECSLSDLREKILRVWRTYFEEEKFSSDEYENLTINYELYKKQNGNTFIDSLYQKMQKWEIYK